jgi:hypothetical protein
MAEGAWASAKELRTRRDRPKKIGFLICFFTKCCRIREIETIRENIEKAVSNSNGKTFSFAFGRKNAKIPYRNPFLMQRTAILVQGVVLAPDRRHGRMNLLRYILVASALLLHGGFAFAQGNLYMESLRTKDASEVPFVSGMIHPTGGAVVNLTDNSIKILDPAALTERFTLGGLRRRISVLQVSPNGEFIVSCGIDGQVNVWRSFDGTPVKDFVPERTVVVGADIIRNTILVSTGSDGEVKVSDVTTGKKVSSFSIDKEIAKQAIHPDERMAVFGGMNGEVHVYDIVDFKKQRTIGDAKMSVTALRFSPDGRFLAAGTADGTILIWDVQSWSLLKRIQAHRGDVTQIAFDPRTRWVLTAGNDSSLLGFALSNYQKVGTFTGRALYATIGFIDEQTFVAATTDGVLRSWRVLEKAPDVTSPIIVMTRPMANLDGTPLRYYGSELTVEGIACDDSLVERVTVNGTVTELKPLAQYDTLRLPPGMKAKSFRAVMNLGGTDRAAIEVKATDWIGNATVHSIPIGRVGKDQAVEILSPTPDSEIEGVYVRVQFKNWFDIASYSVMVNLIEMVDHKAAETRRIGDVLTEEVTLVLGYNQIQINAYTMAGERITKMFGVMRKASAVIAEEVPVIRGSGPQKWAVVVGVSDYAHPGIPSLKYADVDAQAYADFLRTPEGGGFDNNHMRVLLNRDATIANVQDALSNFLAQAIDIDLVVIYFAGHGAPEPARPSNLYLLTHDSDPSLLRTSAFPMWQIQDVLSRYISAKRIVVFSDACHSGGISADFATRGINVTRMNPINQYLADLARSKEGVVVFTASAAGEFSQEYPELGHGVFTYYLLDGLKGAADLNNDYTITINELMQYVEEQVKRRTRGAQNPTRSQTMYDKDLTIAVRPK